MVPFVFRGVPWLRNIRVGLGGAGRTTDALEEAQRGLRLMDTLEEEPLSAKYRNSFLHVLAISLHNLGQYHHALTAYANPLPTRTLLHTSHGCGSAYGVCNRWSRCSSAMSHRLVRASHIRGTCVVRCLA